MGSCGRESRDAIFHLASKYGSPKSVFTLAFWRSEYAWHDTFGKRWNRLVRCRMKGHTLVKVSDPGEVEEHHCFFCEQSWRTENREGLT